MNEPWADLEKTLSAKYARTRLGTFPTPVAPLSLPANAGSGDLWIKRDDLSSSLYGGNKTRKLEFLLSESTRPVLTFGPWGSHHVLSTALHAQALGRRCAAVLVPQHMTPHHHDIHEAILGLCDPVFELSVHPRVAGTLMKALAEVLWRRGERYEFCPPGGTSPLGTLGYVLGGLELAAQVKQGALPEPRRVFVPLGTGGTAAGLAIAFAIAGLETETVAVRVVPRVALPKMAITLLLARTLKRVAGVYSPIPSLGSLRLTIENGFSRGYAHPTEDGEEALSVGSEAGVALESTYSAKTFAAFLSSAKEPSPRQGPSLFWQTFSPIVPL